MAALVVLCSLASGIPVKAQRMVAVGESVDRTNRMEEMLQRQVTLSLDRVSLKEAVNAIAANAGVIAQYQGNVLDAVSRVVSLRADRLSLAEALGRVLSGTNLQAVPTSVGVLTIKTVAPRPEVVQGTITGKVINAKTKQPIVGATILLDDATKGVLTDDDGTFRMLAADGEHTVYVRSVGMVRQSKRVTVADGKTAVVEFILEPSASVLDEVVVTGTVVATERKAIPNPITVITAEDIQKRGITRIEQFFRGEVPGVFALEKGAAAYDAQVTDMSGANLGSMVKSDIYVRGASKLSTTGTNPLKTYIDGVELLDPSYLGTIDPQSIERIEIITGPQAATVYGSGAMGGVMQIFTKKGERRSTPDLTLNLRYGMLENNISQGRTPSHAHSLNAAGGTGPEFSYSGNLSYTYTGQWQPGYYASQYGGSIGATHTRGGLTANGSVSLTRGKNGAYDGAWAAANPRFRALIASGELVESGCCARLYEERKASSSNQTASLAIDHRTTSYWTNNITLGKSQNTFGTADLRPQLWFPHDTMLKVAGSVGERSTASYTANFVTPSTSILSSSMSLGLNGTWVDQTNTMGCLPNRTSTTYYSCYGGFSLSVGVSRTLNSRNVGGFGRWQVGLFDQLYLTFGLRAEHDPSYGLAHKIDWTPSNGIAYTRSFGDLTMKLLGSYGRATRPPSPTMRLSVMSNYSGYEPAQIMTQFEAPDLTPEYSRGPQMGIEMYYGGRGSLVLNHYRQKVTDLIQNVPVDSISAFYVAGNTNYTVLQYRYLNAATIRQQGWEATGSLNLWLFALKGTYTWSDSRVLRVHPLLSGSSSWYVGRGDFGIPTHTGNLNVTYAHGGTSMTLTSNYVGAYNRTSGETEMSMRISNARIKTYNERFRGSVAVSNRPGYVKSNLAVSHRLSSWASATLNVDNMTDSYDSDARYALAALGRQTLIGLSLRYPSRR